MSGQINPIAGYSLDSHGAGMNRVIKTLSILFAVHGILYFCLGVGVNYREETWVKYVKYVMVMAYPILLWNKITMRRFFAFVAQNVVFGAFLLARVVWTGTDVELPLFLNFFFSSLMLLVPIEIMGQRDWLDVIIISGAVTIGFAFIEYFFLQDVNACNDLSKVYGYYRVGSCYLSFNTCGAVLSLSCIAYLYGFNIKWRSRLNAVLFVCSGLVIVLTGSRASLIAYSLLVLFAAFNLKIRFKCILLSVLVVLAAASFYLVKDVNVDGIAVNREDAAESTDMRAEQFVILKQAVAYDVFFPLPVTDDRSDCGWIQLYYDFGLIGLVTECVLFGVVFLCCSTIYERLFVVLFSFFMVMQVAVYLFPFSYVFMAFISNLMRGHEEGTSSPCVKPGNGRVII